jgi:hypothetical protein
MILTRSEKHVGEASALTGIGLVCGGAATPESRRPAANRRTVAATLSARVVFILTKGLLLSFSLAFLAACKPSTTTHEVAETINPEELRTRAEGGDAEAQMKLGAAYANGQGVKADYKTAASYYRKAADQGHAGAQIALGELYEAGQGVKRDDAEAVQWYRRAAEQGHPAGQYALAVMYLVGSGVAKDDAEALKWYRASADQGYALALFHLGMRYKKGQGVTADPAEAYKWLTLAAERGVAEATEIRDEVKRGMTREQVAEGKRRAEEFAAKLSATPGR